MSRQHGTALGPGSPVLALDIGASSVKYAVFDDDGGIAHSGVRELVLDRQEAAPEQLAGLVAELVAGLDSARAAEAGPAIRPGSVGVTAPGIVDALSGVVRHSANLGWRDFALRDELAARLGMPVAIGHDVNLAGLAEHRLGAARGARNAMVTVLGTGISSALLVDGQLLSAGGYAGEIGHARIFPIGDARARACSCGAIGCLQTVASAGGLVAEYAWRTGRTVPGAEQVFAAAAAGDPEAAAALRLGIDALALALAQCAALLGPELIVLGGGMAQAGEALSAPLEAALHGLLSFHRRPRLVPAELGRWAGTFGAALLAREAASG
ncbi:MAG: ROK family protein [Renibacterium sp.]|nr:ROK family protein [Renibacterium sp.]